MGEGRGAWHRGYRYGYRGGGSCYIILQGRGRGCGVTMATRVGVKSQSNIIPKFARQYRMNATNTYNSTKVTNPPCPPYETSSSHYQTFTKTLSNHFETSSKLVKPQILSQPVKPSSLISPVTEFPLPSLCASWPRHSHQSHRLAPPSPPLPRDSAGARADPSLAPFFPLAAGVGGCRLPGGR